MNKSKRQLFNDQHHQPKYLIVDTATKMPLSLTWHDAQQVRTALRWQCAGVLKWDEAQAVRITTAGDILDLQGNPVTLTQGVYTQKAWDTFQHNLKHGLLEQAYPFGYWYDGYFQKPPYKPVMKPYLGER